MERKYGYSRCSTSQQDWAIQVEALAKAGVDDRDIFREQASGVKRDRTELRHVLDLLRDDSILYVFALDRLARSQLHLLQIVEEIEAKGAKLVSLRENIDTSTPMGRFFLGVLGSLAAMERELILSRTKAGVALARQRQVRFGRPPKLSPSLIRQVLLAHDDPATTVPETCRVLGISRSSYYSALRAGRQQAQELVIEAA
jgi:DNA invertase Pin-like site-specific DNA recombinase